MDTEELPRLIRELAHPHPAKWSQRQEALADLRREFDGWLHGTVFGSKRSTYVVAAAVPDADGTPWSAQVENLGSFQLKDDPSKSLAPFCRHNFIFPALDNAVEVVEHTSRALILRVNLGISIACALERLSDHAELDLYCAPTKAADLDNFRALACARWPHHLALPSGSRAVWPKFGPRPFWTPSNPEVSLSPARIVNVVRHVFEERFLRLPLRALRTLQDGRTNTVTIPIEFGRCAGINARELAQALTGRLFINHVLFWNRRAVLSDRNEYLQRQADGEAEVRVSFAAHTTTSDPPLVLECVDSRTGVAYSDARWSHYEDPLRNFVAKKDGGKSSMTLTFRGQVGDDLRVFAANWLDLEDARLDAGETRIAFSQSSPGGQRHDFVIQTAALRQGDAWARESFREADGAARAEQTEQRLANWLAAGHAQLAPGRLVSRSEITEAAWRLAPEGLRAAVRWADPPDQTGTMSVRMLPIELEGRTFAVPVSVLRLPGRRDMPHDDLDYECEWLARTLEASCPAGTSLRVQIEEPRNG